MDEKKAGMTYREVEEYSGVSRSVVSSILGNPNYRPKAGSLRRLAVYFRANFDDLWLLAYSRPPTRSDAQESNVIMVPVVSYPVSAGPGAYSDVELWPYRAKDEERQHSFIGIIVKGDCLEPRIRPGEELIVDQEASPRHDDVVVIDQDGEILLKVYERRNGTAWLIAYQHHEPLRVDDNVKILGVVRKVSREP